MPEIDRKVPARKERLAINFFDIERISPYIRQKMGLLKRLDLKKPVDVELDRIEPTKALVFTCDLLTAALIIDMLKSECRREGDKLIQAYIQRKQTWARVLHNEVLTALENGKAILNPDIFPPMQEELAPAIPLKPQRMVFGKLTTNGKKPSTRARETSIRLRRSSS